MSIRNIALGAALAAGLAVPMTASALAIDVTTTDLGGGTWQYSYVLSGGSFNQDEGFTIFFDYTLYGTLSNPVANGDWDPIVAQRDLGAPADGYFDALALVNGASLVDPFMVDFVWLGTGTPPGNQRVETYSLAGGGFQDTTPPGGIVTGGTGAMPEPAPLALLAAGLIGLGVQRAKRK